MTTSRGVGTPIRKVIGAAALLALLGSCGGEESTTTTTVADDITLAAPIDLDETADELPAEEVAAIIALGRTDAGPPPEGEHDHSGHHHGGSDASALDPEQQVALDAEIEEARSVLPDLDSIEEVIARGYVLATAPSPGIGTHWVRWSQILEPFDASNPSMVLFDHSQTPPVLVGYSYAVQSPTAPDGFTGDSDMWHRHTGLCVSLDGWVVRERSTGPDACDGSYIAGGDFWMLHAWIVPGWENLDGVFAPANPKLCPGDTGPDYLRCPDAKQL